MIEQVIYDMCYLEEEQRKDIKSIFSDLRRLPNNIVLAINTYTTYILHKRGVI